MADASNDPNAWHPLADVLAIIDDPKWTWYGNSDCKYVDVRIDTRDRTCQIRDRDGNLISLNQLRRQYSSVVAG